MSVDKTAVEKKLQESFLPIHLAITDISGGCGTSFSTVIVSDKFVGQPLLQRHRMVNSALSEELQSIHAFTMKTLTPEQWEKQQAMH
eukprot:gene15158-6348_t